MRHPMSGFLVSALVRSAPRCRAGEPAGPYLRRCITGALQHHLRDRVRLVRVPRRLMEPAPPAARASRWWGGLIQCPS
jgi:hypothetical protein